MKQQQYLCEEFHLHTLEITPA